jgi:hypothetical protein
MKMRMNFKRANGAPKLLGVFDDFRLPPFFGFTGSLGIFFPESPFWNDRCFRAGAGGGSSSGSPSGISTSSGSGGLSIAGESSGVVVVGSGPAI